MGRVDGVETRARFGRVASKVVLLVDEYELGREWSREAREVLVRRDKRRKTAEPCANDGNGATPRRFRHLRRNRRIGLGECGLNLCFRKVLDELRLSVSALGWNSAQPGPQRAAEVRGNDGDEEEDESRLRRVAPRLGENSLQRAMPLSDRVVGCR